MTVTTPKIKWCPVCMNAAAPKVVRDIDDPRERFIGHEMDVHWYVICDFLQGGCGTRGGHRDTLRGAVDAWNIRKEEPVEESSEAKFFAHVDKLGVEWRNWADNFNNLFINAMKASDERLVKLEDKLFRRGKRLVDVPAAEGTIGAAESKGKFADKPIKTFKFNRMGFLFEVISNRVNGVTIGSIKQVAMRYAVFSDALKDVTVNTELKPPDVFNHRHGARIVMRKLVAHIKSVVINDITRALRRERNRLQDLHWQVRGD